MRSWLFWLPALCALGCGPLPATARAAGGEEEVLPVESAFRLSAQATARSQVDLRWEIADGYYLYRDRIQAAAEGNGGQITLQLPEAETLDDPFFGKMAVYRHTLTASLPVTGIDAERSALALQVTVQGCHERAPKICYPPYTQTVHVDLPTDSKPLQQASNALGPNSATAAVDPFGRAANPLGNQPLPAEQAFVFEGIVDERTATVLARFSMPSGYYLYRDKTEFSIAGNLSLALGAPRWPQGRVQEDAHFGSMVVYYDSVEVPLPIQASIPGAYGAFSITARFQGCQQDGICYPPMQRTLELQWPNPALPRATKADASFQRTGLSEPERFADRIAHDGLASALALFFLVGLGLAFTPCVLPMIPILSGLIAGADVVNARRAFSLSLVYVLASAVVFTGVGILAGLAGQNLQAIMQKPGVLIAFAALFVFLAFSMLGFYPLQLPHGLYNRLMGISTRQRGGSLPGVAAMGALSALLVGPCVAPPLAGAVLYIGQRQDPWFGGAALFAMAIGMGLPVLAFGVSAGKWLPKTGPWMESVKKFFGAVFLAMALWMLERVLDPVWIMLFSGMFLIGIGVHLGALDRLPEPAHGRHKIAKAIGFALLILGALEFIGAASGGRDYLRPLAGWSVVGGPRAAGNTAASEPLPFEAVRDAPELDRALAQSTKPVVLDFYADWCIECKRMERETFSAGAVREAAAPFTLLKADVTAQNAGHQALQRRFGIIGPPATLFFDCRGEERTAMRLVGFETAAAFAQRLSSAAQTCPSPR